MRRLLKIAVLGLCVIGLSRVGIANGAAGQPVSGNRVDQQSDLGDCKVFPPDNPWNRDVSKDALDPNSDKYINSIGRSTNLHPDFGADPTYGIPYVIVSGNQPKVPIEFTDYGDESDPGPYPVPPDAPIEGGPSPDGDRHVLVVDKDNCVLYELSQAFYTNPGWKAAGGAVFDLKSNKLRPDTWTSTDAAGLPIFPGLVRYDEIQAGEINHALRFTVQHTQKGFIHPATHYASDSTNPNWPPMGLRLRLKASYDISKYTGPAKIVLTALKKYGMIVADNGSNWYISGSTDSRWNDDELDQLKQVPGDVFEVVQSGPILR